MWNALRSDLKEFVSTVADDTSNVLSQLDTGLNETDENNNDDDNNDDDAKATTTTVSHAELKEIMTLLRDHPGTYTKALEEEDDPDAVQAFLQDFSLEAQTEVIAQILQDHAGVQTQFTALSPTTVSYEEFWQRYFFRCDEERIAQQLADETERARQARAEALRGGIDAVTNLLGGAVQAVTQTIAPTTTGSSVGDTTAGDGKRNFFGASGRPPFVMNTALDESGESNGDIDDDDDEDEMGWGDDDSDDDFDDDNNNNNDDDEEQIEFTDKVAEDLQAKWKQATEERDQLQQTVHLQAEEIKVLQEKLQGLAPAAAGGSGGSTAEVEELKLKLFEKEAELAAVQSQDHDEDAMDDSETKLSSLTKLLHALPEDRLAQLKSDVFGISDEIKQVEMEKLQTLEAQVQELTQNLVAKEAALAEVTSQANDSGNNAERLATLEQQVQELTQTLATKDAALADMTKKLASTAKELEVSRSQLSSDQANAANADSALQNMEAALQSVQSSLDALQLEHESLQQSSQQARTDAAAQLSNLEARHVEERAVLTAQLAEAHQTTKQRDTALQDLEAELVAVKQQQAALAPIPPSTPDSMSTGVNVEAMTPAFSTPLEASAAAAGCGVTEDDDDEGDDWGDDWD